MFLGGEYIANKDSSFKTIGHIAGIVSVLSGLVNWYFLKGFKQKSDPKSFKLWTIIVHSKLLLSLITLTPLIKFIASDPSTILKIRLVAIIIFISFSPISRLIRETATQASQPGHSGGYVEVNKTR